MDFSSIGRMIITVGVVLIIIGLAISFADKIGLGKLPGDIVVKKGSFSFYFPIVTCIVISVVLSILANLFKKFF